MLINKVMFISLLCTVILTGCNESEENSDLKTIDDYYSTRTIVNGSFTSGRPAGAAINDDYSSHYTYAYVEAIPSKFNYDGPLVGPYVLETVKNGEGEITRLNYSTEDGESVIDDNIDTYTSSEYKESTRSTEANETPFGVTFVYQNETLIFDNDNTPGDLIGNTSSTMRATPLAREQLSTPAGLFDCLKSQLNYQATTTKDGEEIIISSEGFSWIDEESGQLVYSSMSTNYNYVSFAATAEITMTTTLTETNMATPVIEPVNRSYNASLHSLQEQLLKQHKIVLESL